MSTPLRAIILAAGMGKRMKNMTRDLPKCLAIQVKGKSLLNIQLETFRACGIQDMALVRGYMAEKINLPNIEYFENRDYRNNNIMESLFYARAALTGNVIVSYSDIWFESDVVKKLCKRTEDIVIAIDTDWKTSYVGRTEHPVSEAESVVCDEGSHLLKIGKIADPGNVTGEFIGMMKLTETGCTLLKEHYDRAKQTYAGRPFQRAETFRNAYLTDLLQEMVDQGVPIHCENIGNKWREIDTLEDFKNVVNFLGGNPNEPTL